MRLIDVDALFKNSEIIETPYKENGQWWSTYSVNVDDIKDAPTFNANTEEVAALRASLAQVTRERDEAQRREKAAVKLLQTIDWVGSGAKGRIEDAIGRLTGRGPQDGEGE